MRKQLREECNRGNGAVRVAQPQQVAALRQQQEALRQARERNNMGRFASGVFPEPDSALRAVNGWSNGGSTGGCSPEGNAAPGGGGSQTQFMSKDDLARMRHEMREQCRQRQRDQARRRADMDGECPLFLSARMRRMLEFVLEQPPAALDVGERGCQGQGLDVVSLEDEAAKAIAALVFHHGFPPSYIQHFLEKDMPQLRDVSMYSGAVRQLYGDLVERMRNELREDPPTGIDWTCLPDGKLHQLVPARLDLHATQGTAVKIGDRYGVACVDNEEVVVQRKVDDRRPPKTWFGPDDNAEEDYVFRKAMWVDLPIAAHKDEICKLIEDNQVVLIQGETGCGKTTQVPQYILEMAWRLKAENRRAVRIVVTQPRRIAAITVSKRIAEELGEKIGEGVVGYKIRGTTVAGPRCKLLFCTTGVVLRRLANEGTKWMFSPKTVTHLLVDEVHERGVETDFMLTYLKEVQAKRPNLRVILMSATMDTECFLKYFSQPIKVEAGDEQVVVNRPPMVICPAFCYPVEMVYLEGMNNRLGRTRPADAKSPDELRRDPNDIGDSDGIDYDLILQVIEEIERSRDGPWTFATGNVKSWPKDPHRGAILIFMPGLGEITEMMTRLTEQSSMSHLWWVLALHANLPPEDQQTAFSTMLPHGCTRKIIVATNVAETSVTVPDVTCVIDSCRERRNQIDRYSNTPMLREQWCAKDSLKQRRGRAGRVQPGVCFRVLPEKYLDRLDDVTPPEMQRTCLENVYLQVCASGIEDRPGFLAKTPDPPDDTSVLFAQVALEDLGALDNEEYDGLTPLGRHLAALPCHPRLGKILVLGCLLGTEGPCLSICAAMSVRNPMLTTQDKGKRENWQNARLELTDKIGTRSDHCVWAYIMQEWRFGEMRQRDFCRKLGLSYERMCSSMFERKHLCESLVQVGLLPSKFLWNEWYDQDKLPDWNIVRAAVVGGLYPNIIHVERSAPRYQSNSPAEKAKWMRYSVLQRHCNRQDNMSYPKSLNLHPNSLCFGVDQFHCPWLAFYTIQHTTKLYAYDVSEVNPFALLLFGAEPVWNETCKQLEVGGWARFACPNGKSVLPLIKAARAGVQRVLERKLEDVRFDLHGAKELAVCVQLLKTNGLGYRNPSPPRAERSRRSKDDDEFDEWENEVQYMLRKDQEKEDKMKAAWNEAKEAAER